MDKRPNLLTYLQAFAGNWFSRLSGRLGVFSTIYATFAHDPDVKSAFYWTAGICLVVSSYGIWAKERQALVDARGESPKYIPESFVDRLIPPQFVSLKDAAIELLDRFKNTNLKDFAELGRGSQPTPDDVVECYAHYVIQYAPIYALIPPSQTLHLVKSKNPYLYKNYRNLYVKRKDMRKTFLAIRRILNAADSGK